MHQQAVEVRESRGIDEAAFLLTRAAAIAEHGEGREREDERRAREEAARLAAEAEREQARLRREWLNAQDGLIEAEVQRRLALMPPKVVEKEVVMTEERVVKVERPIRWKRLTAVAVAFGVIAGSVGFAAAAVSVEPEVQTVTKTVKAPPKVVTKVVTKIKTVPGPTRTVYVNARPDSSAPVDVITPPDISAPPSGSSDTVTPCEVAYDQGYRDGRSGEPKDSGTQYSPPELGGYDGGYTTGQVAGYSPDLYC